MLKHNSLIVINIFFVSFLPSVSVASLPGTAAYIMEKNTATSVSDDSVNANNLIKRGSPSESSDVRFTTKNDGTSYPENKSLEFYPSSGDYASLEYMGSSNSVNSIGHDFTVEMWIKPTAGPVTPGDPEIQFFSLYSWTSGEYLQIRTQGAGNSINAYFGNKANTGSLVSVLMNQWQHLAVTVNDLGVKGGIDLAVYLNGNRIGSASGVSPMSNTGWKHIYLGSSDSRYLYGGLIDEVVITPGVVDLATIQLHAAQSIVSEAENTLWNEDIVDGFHYRYGRPHLPSYITSYHNPASDIPMDSNKPFMPVEDFVPTGLYAFDWGDATWDYLFTKLTTELNGNSYYINGGWRPPVPPITLISCDIEGQRALMRRAARLGVRIYFQNQCSEVRWPNRVTYGPPRQQVYDQIAAWATASPLTDYAADYELREGLLVWGLTEEIDMETAQDPLLRDCRNNIFLPQDPCHPVIILLMTNDDLIQEELYDFWGESIPLMVTDPYVNSAGVSRDQSGLVFHNKMVDWTAMSMSHNDSIWVVLPSFSHPNANPSQGVGGYKIVTSSDADFYCWMALAHGATGFYVFREYNDDITGRAAYIPFDWQITEEFAAYTRFWKKVQQWEPLLSKWVPKTPPSWNTTTVTGTMDHPDFVGNFVITANTSAISPRSYSIPQDKSYYDVETFLPISGSVSLDPGGGLLLFNGSEAELEKLRILIDGEQCSRYEIILPALQAQVWQTDANDEEMIVAKTELTGSVNLGGKGGIPWIYSQDSLNGQVPGGEILEWGPGVKTGAAMYTPPRPGVNENMVFLKWDFSTLPHHAQVESAALNINFTSNISAPSSGRVAIYPIKANGNYLREPLLEFMPRWEIDQFTLNAGNNLYIEIGGIVQEWIDGQMDNLGLMIIYCGWPSTTASLETNISSTMKVKYMVPYLLGDINKDYKVDMLDMSIIAAQWLWCTDQSIASCDQYWK